MPARVVHLFVSSPGDVDAERKRVEFVAERLNGLFAGVARFETIRWETKFYAAHKSFQPQIREASDCDIIIGIFWARLGSELDSAMMMIGGRVKAWPTDCSRTMPMKSSRAQAWVSCVPQRLAAAKQENPSTTTVRASRCRSR